MFEDITPPQPMDEQGNFLSPQQTNAMNDQGMLKQLLLAQALRKGAGQTDAGKQAAQTGGDFGSAASGLMGGGGGGMLGGMVGF